MTVGGQKSLDYIFPIIAKKNYEIKEKIIKILRNQKWGEKSGKEKLRQSIEYVTLKNRKRKKKRRNRDGKQAI